MNGHAICIHFRSVTLPTFMALPVLAVMSVWLSPVSTLMRYYHLSIHDRLLPLFLLPLYSVAIRTSFCMASKPWSDQVACQVFHHQGITDVQAVFSTSRESAPVVMSLVGPFDGLPVGGRATSDVQRFGPVDTCRIAIFVLSRHTWFSHFNLIAECIERWISCFEIIGEIYTGM